MQPRYLIRSLVLLPSFLFFLVAQGNAFAANSTSAHRVAPAINITGTWKFTTNDPGFEHFTLTIMQVGHKLKGHDAGGQPIRGRVFGRKIRFLVHGASYEDDYGGDGVIGSNGLTMQGTFFDGTGGIGKFQAQKV